MSSKRILGSRPEPSNRPAYYMYRHFIILSTPPVHIRQPYEIRIRHLGEKGKSRNHSVSM
jgi:hypothetical protein